MEQKGVYSAYSLIFCCCSSWRWAFIGLLEKKKSLYFSQHSTEPVTVQYKCQFRCVRRCFGRLLHINCSCVPAFNRCAGIASCMQGAGCAGARQKQRQSVLKSPEPKGRWLFVWSPDRLSLTGFLSGSWLRCCTQFPSADLYSFGIFVMVTWEPSFFFLNSIFFWTFKAVAFWSLHMCNLLLVLLRMADVKHSVPWGNIHKPLKVLVQLDSPSLPSRGWGIIHQGSFPWFKWCWENRCLSPHLGPVSLAVSGEQWGMAGHPILETPDGLSFLRIGGGESRFGFYITAVPIFDFKMFAISKGLRD